MILILNLPDRCTLSCIYLRGNGWGARVVADNSWPLKTVQHPSIGTTHRGLGAGSDGHATIQAAIDTAYENMVALIDRMDSEKPWQPADAAAIAGLNLDLDL